ncbi:MAG TPA: four helix bundle protein [Cytophagaceae bacterium]|jgi:four helix bundle protein|nr:four helix bundle protein [Cytophagaceae bacterium]
MQNYKELKVWQKSHSLTLEIYRVSVNFPKSEVYGLVSQIRRSAYSIPSNIAEGCGKRTQNDLANFLQIALGSTNETEYFILLAKDLTYLKEDSYLELTDKVNEIKAMLINLIKKVRDSAIIKT